MCVQFPGGLPGYSSMCVPPYIYNITHWMAIPGSCLPVIPLWEYGRVSVPSTSHSSIMDNISSFKDAWMRFHSKAFYLIFATASRKKTQLFAPNCNFFAENRTFSSKIVPKTAENWSSAHDFPHHRQYKCPQMSARMGTRCQKTPIHRGLDKPDVMC